MTIIPKKQTSIALVVTAFAIVMIAGTIASVADNSVFANRGQFFNHFNDNNGRHSSTHQSINQECRQHQHSTVITAGPNSPVLASGNNLAGCLNISGGGNAGAHEQ